jgi:hypothetical protein
LTKDEEHVRLAGVDLFREKSTAYLWLINQTNTVEVHARTIIHFLCITSRLNNSSFSMHHLQVEQFFPCIHHPELQPSSMMLRNHFKQKRGRKTKSMRTWGTKKNCNLATHGSKNFSVAAASARGVVKKW